MKKEYVRPELEIYELNEDVMDASISIEEDPFDGVDSASGQTL